MFAVQARQGLLDKLEALSGLGASVPGEAVLELVVELFEAGGEALSPHARDACLDLVATLLPNAAGPARGAMLERLASHPATPPSRLSAWAAGPIETAGPVLRHGRNLAETDLVRVLAAGGPEHLRAAAQRDGVPEAVTDLIVQRGDREALRLALENRSARLSGSSFAAVAGLAWCDVGLREAMVQRADLPNPVVDKLWPSLHVGFKARLIASGWRYSLCEVEEVGREASAALLDAVRAGSLPQSVDTYATLVGEGHVTLDEALAEILQTGRLVEASQLIAGRLKLPEGVALNVLYGVYDQGAAVLARHAALSDDIILHIATARGRLSWVRAAEVRRTLAAAAALTPDEASEIVGALRGLWEGGIANTGARRRFRSAA